MDEAFSEGLKKCSSDVNLYQTP